MRTAVVTALLALFLTGCATSRKSVTQERADYASETASAENVTVLSADSVSEVTEVRTETVRVPMSAVSLTIATDSLRSLPSGASYSGRSGQASVSVSRKFATATEPEYIYVYASCDSLAMECERYERIIKNLSKSYGEAHNSKDETQYTTSHEQEALKENGGSGIGMALKWYFFGLLSGMLATTIIFIKLKK